MSERTITTNVGCQNDTPTVLLHIKEAPGPTIERATNNKRPTLLLGNCSFANNTNKGVLDLIEHERRFRVFH